MNTIRCRRGLKNSSEAMGVNVFGYDGFADDAAVGVAVDKLFAEACGGARVRNTTESQGFHFVIMFFWNCPCKVRYGASVACSSLC